LSNDNNGNLQRIFTFPGTPVGDAEDGDTEDEGVGVGVVLWFFIAVLTRDRVGNDICSIFSSSVSVSISVGGLVSVAAVAV
jgi:hypothetical protein